MLAEAQSCWKTEPLPTSLPGHCLNFPGACELWPVVVWSPPPCCLHAWDDILCGDYSLLGSVTAWVLLVFSDWVGHQFLSV